MGTTGVIASLPFWAIAWHEQEKLLEWAGEPAEGGSIKELSRERWQDAVNGKWRRAIWITVVSLAIIILPHWR